MKKIGIKILKIVIVIIILTLITYPNIEIAKDNKLIKFQYTDSIGEFDKITCYDDGYSYDQKRDISISNISHKNFLFFHVLILEYKEGNICDTEFLLEESYVKHFIENAEIEYNEYNINIEELIKDKKAIELNKRYPHGDEVFEIGYILDGKHEEMFVFYYEDLLIIQVGLSDEGPKFIAYKN